jgi:hypothetical protein
MELLHDAVLHDRDSIKTGHQLHGVIATRYNAIAVCDIKPQLGLPPCSR